MFINKTLKKILLLLLILLFISILVLFILEHKNKKDRYTSSKKLNKYLESDGYGIAIGIGIGVVVVLVLIYGVVYFNKKSAVIKGYYDLVKNDKH